MIIHNSSQQLGRQVYEHLREQLRRGVLKPGSAIKTSQLIQELGISKTPLRDALIQLETEGFVSILPQRGVVINSLTPKEAKHIYQILGSLESGVIIEVFPRLEANEIAKLKSLNEQMRSLAGVSQADYREYNNKNILFHDVYLNLCENEFLLKYVRILKQRLYDFPTRDYGIGWQHRNAEEHDEFIKLIETGNAVQVADYMRDVHWTFRYPEALSEVY